jgi:hypothetical protein
MRLLEQLVEQLRALGIPFASSVPAFCASCTGKAGFLAQEVGGPTQLDPLRELGLNLWGILTWPISLGLVVFSC